MRMAIHMDQNMIFFMDSPSVGSTFAPDHLLKAL